MDVFEETDAGMAGPWEAEESKSDVIRERPELPQARKALVARIQQEVRADKERWAGDFARMKEDMEYCRLGGRSSWVKSGKYVANITLRHVNGKVAALYAKNPKAVVRRKKRRDFQRWDGSLEQLNVAMQAMQMMPQITAMGGGMMLPPQLQEAMFVLQDAAKGIEQRKLIDNVAETLEILYAYFIGEQNPNFKRQMKAMVRRAVTTGIGYVKLGFQRSMEYRPETMQRIAEIETRLASIRVKTDNIRDKQIDDDSADVEALRLEMQTLESEKQVISYEGLVFDFPQSTAIIPSRFCYQLDGFLGAPMVTEEIPMTLDEVQAVFNVDLRGASFRGYRDGRPITNEADRNKSEVMVWVTYNKNEGMVYVTCDGYEDFLREPAPPEIVTDRFWPWFPFILNEVCDPSTIFPPSDVRLLMPMQDDYNRARQSLREHRRASLPAWVTRRNSLTEEDTRKLSNKTTGMVLEMDGLQPTQKVTDLLQPLAGVPVDPALYETATTFDDFMRVGGSQEANLGGTSNSTATESSIAEASRMSGLQSNIDDLDDLLSALARAAGQVLLSEMSFEQVEEIVGPGAVWPEMSIEEISKEIYLEIEAGSSGRPNKAMELNNWKSLAPILQATPGIKPSWFARETIRRMDDKLDFTDAYDENIPSMQMLNQVKQMTAAPPGSDPMAQGAQGANNAQQPPGDQMAGPEGPEGLDPQMQGGMEGGAMSSAGPGPSVFGG